MPSPGINLPRDNLVRARRSAQGTHAPPKSLAALSFWQVCVPEHTRHEAPDAPHASGETPLKQPPVSQHPSQLLALQVTTAPPSGPVGLGPQERVLLHSSVAGHATHNVPPAPHAVASEPARQVSVF